MINEIIDAISIALDSEFEDGYKIHKDEMDSLSDWAKAPDVFLYS